MPRLSLHTLRSMPPPARKEKKVCPNCCARVQFGHFRCQESCRWSWLGGSFGFRVGSCCKRGGQTCRQHARWRYIGVTRLKVVEYCCTSSLAFAIRSVSPGVGPNCPQPCHAYPGDWEDLQRPPETLRAQSGVGHSPGKVSSGGPAAHVGNGGGQGPVADGA